MSESTNKTTPTPPKRPPFAPGGGGGRIHGEKPKNFKATMKKILKLLADYKVAFIVVILFAILSTIFTIAGPKILSRAITVLGEGMLAKYQLNGSIDFAKIGGYLLTLLGLYGLSSLFNFIQGYTMAGISQKITFDLRRQISEKIHRMPMKYFESRTVGEVLSRITNDIDTLGHSLNQSITQFISSIVTIIGVFIMMLTISPLMTLIALVILPISMLIIMGIIKISQKYFKSQQRYLGELNGQIEEHISGHNVIKLFNYEDDSISEFNETNKKLYDSAWRSLFFSGIMQPIMNFVSNLGYVGVTILGGILAFRNVIMIGDIPAFTQYLRSFTQPIGQLAQISNMLQSMAAAAERVYELLDEEEEVQTILNSISTDTIHGEVSFEHVQFGYDPEQIIINDFSSIAHPGQMTAIVGPTGAGKTTMVKLLMRFYDVTSGAIKIDGHNIQDFNRSDLRNCFSMVLQDTWLFNGTIMENLRYGKLSATDDEVIAAAKAAHADRFIKTLPSGYQMILNEDATNISQGQKQLLTIARAILANSPILILDEATSSVDTRTEVRIQRAMNNLMKGRTSFVIAHRLSTIKNADNILVMKDGDIIEQGNHETLIAQHGFYYELYNSQFEDASA